MTKTLTLIASLIVLSLTAAGTRAVTLNSVRVVAKDAEALGKFYAAAFGLKETNRLQTQTGPELFLNFGATAEAATGQREPGRRHHADPGRPRRRSP